MILSPGSVPVEHATTPGYGKRCTARCPLSLTPLAEWPLLESRVAHLSQYQVLNIPAKSESGQTSAGGRGRRPAPETGRLCAGRGWPLRLSRPGSQTRQRPFLGRSGGCSRNVAKNQTASKMHGGFQLRQSPPEPVFIAPPRPFSRSGRQRSLRGRCWPL